MSDTAVIFDIIGRDRVSPALAASSGAFSKMVLGIAAGAAFAGVKLVDMAANFQQGMTRLQTGAGESASNMKLVSNGILQLAGQVGESTKDLAAGMYLVESAGYHGADGLKVLKVAAEGAKVGNADMRVTADAVTTALNAYHMGAGGATAATNALIAAEGQGKTTLEELAGSLSSVAPIAAVAHVSLNELLAAMATMTSQGTPAANAATYLRQVIGQLSNPTQAAAKEMDLLGLKAIDVSQNLGKNGLASTLTMLTDAIEKKMGPAGTVLVENLTKASKHSTDFQKVLANLPPAQQTYIAALARMVGGVKSMQAALQLTGSNMSTFKNNIDVINQKVKTGGDTVEGWSLVQKNFNQRMAEARGTVEALGIRIGTALLPYAQDLLHYTMNAVMWFTRHAQVARDLAIVIGTLAGAFIAYRVVMTTINIAMKAWAVATKIVTAAQWLLNFAMDANPIGLIIIAIGLLVVAFVYLWNHSAAFRNFWIKLWKSLKESALEVAHWFAGPFANFFVSAWNGIISAGKAIGNFFTKTIPSWFHAVVNEAQRFPGQVANFILGSLKSMAYAAGFMLGLVVKEFLALPGQIWGIIRSLWNTAVNIWVSSTNAVVSFTVSWGTRIVGWLMSLPGKVWAIITSLWTRGIAMWQTAQARIEAFAAALPGRVMSFLSSLPGRVSNLFSSMASQASSHVSRMVSTIVSYVSSLPGKLASLGSSAIQGLINGITGAVGRLYSLASSIAGHFLSGFKNALGIHSPSTVFQFEVAQQGIGEGLVRGINAARTPVYAAATELAERTVEPFRGPMYDGTSGTVVGGNAGGSAPREARVTFAGNTDSAFATAFMRMYRQGLIQITT